MDYLKAAILGVVEGVTEFIPVSSTGHLIVASRMMGLDDPRWDTFAVVIQLGAILSVLFLYWPRFLALLRFGEREGFSGARGIFLLALTTFPALAIGALAHDFIKQRLFNPATVAIGLGVGGLVLILLDFRRPTETKTSLDSIGWKDALAVGFFQCLAMWPGTSRAAATIIGARLMGFDRKTAAEYSFFAAVPVIFAAGLYDLYQNLPYLRASDAPLFAVGLAVSFVAAWLSIRFFIRYLSRHGMAAFGVYRILAAPLIYFFLV